MMAMARTADSGILSDGGGFTIVEVLIVIAIMSALMGLAVLSFSNMQRRYSEEQLIKQLHGDLLNARMRAVQHVRDHFVSLSSSTVYRVYEDTSPAPDGNGQLDTASDTLISSQNVLVGHTLIKFPSTMTVVPFSSKGLLSTGTPSGWVGIDPSAGAEYDCVVIDQIKTSMGSMNGANCVVK